MNRITRSIRKLPRRVRVVLVGLVLALGIGGGIVATSGSASASSAWCTFYGVHVIGNVSIPSGQYCFGVAGQGEAVYATSGQVTAPSIINFSEVVRFYNDSGYNYYTYNGPVHAGYAYGSHEWTTPINGLAQRGSACGELLSGGQHVTQVCVQIL